MTGGRSHGTKVLKTWVEMPTMEMLPRTEIAVEGRTGNLWEKRGPSSPIYHKMCATVSPSLRRGVQDGEAGVGGQPDGNCCLEKLSRSR